MAKIYRAVRGKKIEKWLADQSFTQEALEAIAFEAGAKAEADLLTHRNTGDASIEIEHGRVDWYVILSDTRGQNAALSIEYGRQPYEVQYETADGRTVIEQREGMDGLFILHKAFDLPKNRRGEVNIRRIKLKQKRGR